MDDEVEVMLRMHEELRSEILQSIQFQNRVILSGAVVVAVIYGLQFSGVLPQLTEEDPTFELIIATLPPVVTISIALWIVEQSRMMRAGRYLSHLENKINEHLEGPVLSWENWLRDGDTPAAHRIHHNAQRLGYLGFFVILGVLSLLLYAVSILGVGVAPPSMEADFVSAAFGYFLVNVSVFVAVIRYAFPIIVHGDGEDGIQEYRSFRTWERAYHRRMVGDEER